MQQTPRRGRAKGKQDKTRSRFTVAFSKAAAITAGFVLVAAIVWAFFMGFMVGRGQNPAQRMEQMTTTIMRNEKNAPSVAQPQNDVVAERILDSGSNSAQSGQTESLVQSVPAKNAAEERSAFVPLHSPRGEALAAWGKDDKPAVESGENRKKTEIASSREEQFNWVFQMAAFKDKADADRVRVSLEKNGYRAALVRDGKMFLVHLRLRGGETEVARLREQARRLRLGSPLMQSRIAVTDKKAKR